jgi:hypothetical protein
MCHMRRRIHVSYEEEDTCVYVVVVSDMVCAYLGHGECSRPKHPRSRALVLEGGMEEGRGGERERERGRSQRR